MAPIRWGSNVKRLVSALLVALALLVPSSAQAQTRLGVSMFWGLRGLQDEPFRLGANLAYARDVIGADYVRTFLVLGGDLYPAPDGNRYDAWRDASVPLDDPRLPELLARYTDHVFDDYGMKVHWVLVGTRTPVSTVAAQDRATDLWMRHARGREHKIELVEVWNEYSVNGGTLPEMHRIARRLRAALGAQFPIALSTPHAVMMNEAGVQAELGRLFPAPDYGGANVFTYHHDRGSATPRWGPQQVLGLVGRVARRNSEPRGPGASSGGNTSDADIIARDYAESIRAGEDGYVYHTTPGVWGGRCYGFPDENRWANLWDVPNSEVIAGRLRALRAPTNSPPTPAPPGPAPTPQPPAYPPTIEGVMAALAEILRRLVVLEGLVRQ